VSDRHAAIVLAAAASVNRFGGTQTKDLPGVLPVRSLADVF
jgi:hypothetical protein